MTRRVVIVDDSRVHCHYWKRTLESRYREQVEVETYSDPKAAVEHLDPNIDLLLLDWEMPGLDGRQVLEAAAERGVDLKRVIITSGHEADRLHEEFDSTGCLAVINKTEPEQQAAFHMILDSIMKR